MKITFLGTGAVGWNAETAKMADARGINRRHTSILIGESLLIDPNPDVPEALATYGIAPQDITHVLVSHSHDDHFDADTVRYLASFHPIELYGDQGIACRIPQDANVRFHAVSIREEFSIPQGRITPLLSTHCVDETGENCLHYIVKMGEKALFYGCDGAWFTAETWCRLSAMRYDAMVLDATFGDDPMQLPFKSYAVRFHHNTPEMLNIMLQALRTAKAVDDKTAVVACHLSPFYYPDMESCRLIFDPLGMISAYDGMVLQI